MVATVFAVVVFLLGVLVGRGLRTPVSTEIATITSSTAADPTLSEPSSSSPAPGADDTPVSARESLTYAERLESPTPLPDDSSEPGPLQPLPPTVTAQPPVPTTTPAAPVASAQATAKPAALPLPGAKPAPAPAPTAADASLAEPPGSGFVVQVMAVNTRAEADAIARRLAAKGYPTFVTTTGVGRVTYRVRVGKYDSQREADAVSARLKKEEQFNPWVTR